MITAETAFLHRRQFLKRATWAGVGAAIAPLIPHQSIGLAANPIAGTVPLPFDSNLQFSETERPLTDRLVAASFNNFYEFGDTKSIWPEAQALPTENWQLEVTGLVKYPQVYDLEDLWTTFDLEERIYRLRCVEAWSMVVPWLGFPMSALIQVVEPLSHASFVRFTSYYDPVITPGPASWGEGNLPFPYIEGLRLDEMVAEVAFFAVGIYGHSLPKQHGAPIRMVVPWKYGYKGAKSLVKIEFLAEQPATFWNTLFPDEYPFESNVNPDVPHPRWSQQSERLLISSDRVEVYPTLLYNGYGDYVAHLYAG